MKPIDIFYQGENVAEIQHLEVAANATFGELRTRLTDQHGLPPDTLLFLEDDEQPVDDAARIAPRGGERGVTVQMHRCRRVNVAVTFNNKTLEHTFSPSNTVGHVKQWMAVHKFDMTKDDASEHVLQLAGTTTRPSPSVHVGILTNGKTCGIAFDLVAEERVNGAAAEAA